MPPPPPPPPLADEGRTISPSPSEAMPTKLQSSEKSSKASPSPTAALALPLISSAELRRHTSASSLWLSIHGLVYDVTNWLPIHPGGDLPLLSLAGLDVTDPFLAYHPPSAHSSLAPFLIGRLSPADRHVSPVSLSYRNLLARISSQGLFDRPGLLFPISIFFTCALLLASLSLVFLFPQPSFFLHLLAGAFMGCAWIQSGWLGHDSGHYKVISHPHLNRIAQILTGNCLAGISIAWWKRNHNAHHIACNSLDHDPDLQHMPFFAVSSRLFSSIRSYYYQRTMQFDPLTKFLISYQHITFYPVMGFARINLFAQSIILLLTKKNIPDRGLEILGVLFFWVWYPLLVSCLPNWADRIAFVVASFNVTGIQHIQFCLNHFSSEVYLGAPRDILFFFSFSFSPLLSNWYKGFGSSNNNMNARFYLVIALVWYCLDFKK